MCVCYVAMDIIMYIAMSASLLRLFPITTDCVYGPREYDTLFALSPEQILLFVTTAARLDSECVAKVRGVGWGGR